MRNCRWRWRLGCVRPDMTPPMSKISAYATPMTLWFEQRLPTIVDLVKDGHHLVEVI
jgi:hypothetical protein